MARQTFTNPAIPKSDSPHSNAVRIGNLIFVSGFPDYDDHGKIPKGDFGAQARQALKHIKSCLEFAGSGVEKIGKVNVYLDRRANFEELNEIYREFLALTQLNGLREQRSRRVFHEKIS